jgi:arylsulfatase A-like enzyme
MNGGWLSYMRLGGTSNDYTDGRVTEQAISILEENAKIQSTQPLFLAVGYVRPHVPFSAPERFFDLYPLDKISIEDVPEFDRNDIPSAHLSDRPYQLDMTDQEKRIMIQAYYASISFIDEQVGKLISKLEELKLKESTLIIFVSDHGFLLGEHDLWQKPNLFENTLRIPLIISDPRSAKSGLSSDSLIELIDIYPTILELSDLEIPDHVVGRSFAKLINRPSMPFRKSALSQSHARVTQPNLKKENIFGYSVRTEQFRYTEWAKGTHGIELYDHTNDSGENTNLFSHNAYQDVEAELRRLLRERIAESEASLHQIIER